VPTVRHKRFPQMVVYRIAQCAPIALSTRIVSRDLVCKSTNQLASMRVRRALLELTVQASRRTITVYPALAPPRVQSSAEAAAGHRAVLPATEYRLLDATLPLTPTAAKNAKRAATTMEPAFCATPAARALPTEALNAHLPDWILALLARDLSSTRLQGRSSASLVRLEALTTDSLPMVSASLA
jgi:hypothetical protein